MEEGRARRRAAGLLNFQNALSVALCMDGQRGGQPAKELLGAVVENCDTERVAVLAHRTSEYQKRGCNGTVKKGGG